MNIIRKKKACDQNNQAATMKSGASHVVYHSSKKKWRIRCIFYACKGFKGERIESGYYATELDAEADKELFQHAVDTDGAKSWKTNKDVYLHSFPKKRKNSTINLADQTLNACSKKQFASLNKRLRMCRSDKSSTACNLITRSEFKYRFNRTFFSENDINRFIRTLDRRVKRDCLISNNENKKIEHIQDRVTFINEKLRQLTGVKISLSNSIKKRELWKLIVHPEDAVNRRLLIKKED